MPRVRKPEQVQADEIKALSLFVSHPDQGSRYCKDSILFRGGGAVATDGRRLIVAREHHISQPDGCWKVKRGKMTDEQENPGEFPNFHDVIPKHSDYQPLRSMKLELGEDCLLPARTLCKACGVLCDKDKYGATAPIFVINPDNSLGAVFGPGLGHLNCQPGNKIMGCYNPMFIWDALQAFHLFGYTEGLITASVHINKGYNKPLLLEGGVLQIVIIPVNSGRPNIDLEWAAETIEVSQPVPA